MNMKKFGKVDYSKAKVPPGYKCECGATGIKLWREYNTFLDHQRLLCAECAAKDQKKDISSIDSNGMRLLSEYNWGRDMRSDSIGWLIPAVPTEEGDNFWGYTSVPENGVRWWRRLPTLKKVLVE